MRVLVFLDGTVADPDAPAVRADDLGLLRGDGIFETVLVAGGVPRELDAHLARLVRSAEMLDLPRPDVDAWRRCVHVVLDNWRGPGEFAVRLNYTRGVDSAGPPTAYALATDIPAHTIELRRLGVSAITLERGIDTELAGRAPWLLLGAKTLSYAVNMAAIREATRRGADEVIFIANDGTVLEGPTSTVVIATGRTLYTPPAQLGILPGTTQAALFLAAELAGWTTKIEPLTVDDLHTADGVFLASSVRKITRVHTLDGRPLATRDGLAAELDRLYESRY
ncbi:MAG: aminodeoxychorismate lyase [Sciscionella sp.]|nr:aminodeoxychorismate lyase [Sciscionella sp.]